MSTHFAARATLTARALIAAAAALTITFTQERSSVFSLVVFGVFAILTAALFAADVFLARGSAGHSGARRWCIILAAIHVVAAAATFAWPLEAATRFHWILVGWALIAGAVELASGLVHRATGRDRIAVGSLTLLLAVILLVVSPEYALEYFVDEADRWFTLTGTMIGVGLFGGWAAIVAVYLGIGALSPAQKPASVTKDPA